MFAKIFFEIYTAYFSIAKAFHSAKAFCYHLLNEVPLRAEMFSKIFKKPCDHCD